MLEDKNVQTTGGVEVTTPPPEKVETTEVDQPLTEEKVSQMLEAKVEELRRHYQSVADRDIKAARKVEGRATRRAETAESQVNAINQLAARNPQLATQLRIAATNAQARIGQERENREQTELARQDYFDRMASVIGEFGIDRNDQRLDLAEDAEDANVATDRIMTSISKIVKEDAKKADEKRSQELKDFEVRIRKDLGAELVDTSTSSAVSKGIPTDMNKFREWVDGLSMEEYGEKKKDIDEMMSKGLIK